MVDRFDGCTPAEAVVVLAADMRGDPPSWKAGALRAMLASGQVERCEVEEAFMLARGAFDRVASGGTEWGPEDGPNMGQAVVVLSAVLR